MPSPNEKPDITALLLKAITKESIFRLVDLLRDIIKHSPEGRKIASKWLLAAKDDAKSEPVPTAPVASGQSAKEESTEPTASIPMTSRFETCLYCLKKFDVTKNSATSCRYHVGPDMIDEEFFRDEIIAGVDVDNEECREAWPEKFSYTCCGRDLLEEVCQVGWHKVAKRPSKRVIPEEVRWG
ncbi:hypothetical protein N7517_000483 [Penicillium concentricum]|uniref:C2H2-type domain-containing protein n=1 Tax=Penicillium concentricum TaxID=293559 RepID=A0A9W9VHY6_9EURO|nr:uncharacterized protein N7517_000483 [Penicillium concentricum]KAJ5382572.1 hypothetical protein N7517_000483 [Penicillium concentricum]